MSARSDGNPTSSAELMPPRLSMKALREAARTCTACPLHERGTRTVFGEGLRRARIVFVGEQPGDDEDRQGRPFVGPAGRVLDRALDEAGIDRSDAYVTNVVKHFKWVPKGKLRIHQTPNAREIAACFPWLEAELELVKPRVFVALGATAAKALFGSGFRVSVERGKFFESDYAPYTTGTVHPSSILRSRTDEERRAARRRFTGEMRAIARVLAR